MEESNDFSPPGGDMCRVLFIMFEQVKSVVKCVLLTGRALKHVFWHPRGHFGVRLGFQEGNFACVLVPKRAAYHVVMSHEGTLAVFFVSQADTLAHVFPQLDHQCDDMMMPLPSPCVHHCPPQHCKHVDFKLQYCWLKPVITYTESR